MALKSLVYSQIITTDSASPSVGSATAEQNVAKSFSLIDGVGAGKADISYAAQRQLAASANESLDLVGVLTDVFGRTIAAAKVKALLIVGDPDNTGDLIVGAATAPFLGPLGGTAPTFSVRPGGFFMFGDPGLGWTVTATTGDLLKVVNSSSAVAKYQIAIVAASA